MALEVKEVKRVFKHGEITLDDIPGLTPREVAKTYAGTYPELVNSTPEFKGIEGNVETYTFNKRAGTKG